MIVYSTSNLAFVQRFFTSAPIQYLGEISYSMYIVHGAVTRSIGFGLMNLTWGIYGLNTEPAKAFGWSVGAAVTIVVTIWVADIFMRAVDIPVVKFAKRFEEKCTVS